MSHNTFGHLFRVTTWGESHGPALGCVVDGCPPGIALTEADLQVWLDKRKPGGSKFVTQRQEADAVRFRNCPRLPARPCGLCLYRQIRSARLSRRRPLVGA